MCIAIIIYGTARGVLYVAVLPRDAEGESDEDLSSKSQTDGTDETKGQQQRKIFSPLSTCFIKLRLLSTTLSFFLFKFLRMPLLAQSLLSPMPSLKSLSHSPILTLSFPLIFVKTLLLTHVLTTTTDLVQAPRRTTGA